MRKEQITINLLIISVWLCAVSALTCQGAQVLDVGNQKCLVSKSQCQGYLSTDQKTCLSKCPADQKVYQYKVDGKLVFNQCYLCPTKTYLQIDLNFLNARCVSNCSPYETSDDQAQICHSCDQKIINVDGELTCASECPEDNYLQIINQGKNFYYCTSEGCDQGYITQQDSYICIQMNQCTTYLQSNVCVPACSSKSYELLKLDTEPFSRCVDVCNFYTYEADGKKQCLQKCPANYVADLNRVCIKQEDCTLVISQDGLNCQQSCPFYQYKKPITDKLSKCTFCYKIFVEDTGECLDECPADQIELKGQHQCVLLTDCNLFSADNRYCVEQCEYPDLYDGTKCINSCIGQTSCQSECPNAQYKFITQYSYNCQQFCSDKLKISSNKKICVDKCYKVNEMEPNSISKICRPCKSNEYPFLNNQSITCVPLSQLTLEEIIQEFQQQTNNMNSYNDYEDKKSKLSDIFTQMIKSTKESSSAMDSINNILSMALSFHLTANDNLGTSQTIIENQLQGFKAFIEIPLNMYTYKQDFEISAFNSNPEYSLTQGKENYNFNTDQVKDIIALSIKNPFCIAENCSLSQLFIVSVDFTQSIKRMLQQSELPSFTVTFPIDSSIKQVQNLVCVSYDTFGKMNGSVEKTKLSDNKSSITCTFQQNAAIYLDTTCIFVDKANCESDGEDTLNGGQIAGIVIGSVFGVLLIAFIVFKIVGMSKLSKIPVQSNPQKQITTEQNLFI